MKIPISLCASLLAVLCACSSSRHLAVGESNTGASAAGKSSCKAEVACLPNGNCLVTCTGPNGKKCEVELGCDGGTCEVVRCDGGGCLPGGGAGK